MATKYSRKSIEAYKFGKSWQEKSKVTKKFLSEAQKKMKKWADGSRRHVEFQEGDLVHKGLLRQHKEEVGRWL